MSSIGFGKVLTGGGFIIGVATLAFVFPQAASGQAFPCPGGPGPGEVGIGVPPGENQNMCVEAADDGSEADSDSKGDPALVEQIRRDRDERKGWLPTFNAIAISLDGKTVGSSGVAPRGSLRTSEAAAKAAIEDCERDATGPCKLVASRPLACSAAAYGTRDRKFIGFAALPLPPRNASGDMIRDAEIAGKAAAVKAANAECRKGNGGTCNGSGDDRSCSDLIGAY